MEKVRSQVNWFEIGEQICLHYGGKPSGDGKWQVRCPVHADGNPSLSIKATFDTLVWHCHAGCSQESVRAALIKDGFFPKISTVVRPDQAKRGRKEVAKYVYRSADGHYLYEKVRFEPKSFIIQQRLGDKVVNSIKDMPKVLYRLDEFAERGEQGDILLICEGEKDVDNFLARGISGYFATTNIAGSSERWCDEYTDQISCFHRVIIVEDNDEAGERRTEKLLSALGGEVDISLLRFNTIPGLKFQGADLTDYLNLVKDNVAVAEFLRGAQKHSAAKNRGKKAKPPVMTRLMFEELLNGLYPKKGKDLFTGDFLFFDDKSDMWHPVVNEVDVLKSEVIEKTTIGDWDGSPAHVEPHIASISRGYEAKLLVDFPDWDGIDRIKDVVAGLVLDEVQGFDHYDAYQFIASWLAGVWRRIENPEYFNPILIFKGPQRIGKDYLLNYLSKGFGQWAKSLQLTNSKDDYIQLSNSAILKISEFDRSSVIATSTLKDLLTRSDSSIREPYQRRAVNKVIRCSFLASINPDDIYRDSTGHSRYWPIYLHGIDLPQDYGTMEGSKQILAQGRELARQKFKAADESLFKMRHFLETRTPNSIVDDCLEYTCDLVHETLFVDFKDRRVIEWHELIKTHKGFVPFTLLSELKILEKVARNFGQTERWVKLKWQNAGITVRRNTGLFLNLNAMSGLSYFVKKEGLGDPLENEPD